MCCCSRRDRCESANQTAESRLRCGGEVVATSVAGASCLRDQLSQRSCKYSAVNIRFYTLQLYIRVISYIAVFPILADPVDVKKGDQLRETVSQSSIQPDKVDPPMGS